MADSTSYPFFVLLLLCVIISTCLGDASVVLDFTTKIGATSSQSFGAVDNGNLVPTTALSGLTAGMNIKFLRVVDPDSTLRWMNYTEKTWSQAAVKAYFDAIETAYAAKGEEKPTFIIDIKKWPTWMSTASTLPTNLFSNYSQMCADLVYLVNIVLGKNVTHWQPWVNVDSSYSTSTIPQLFQLYDMSATAMKQVDPTIKVGPAFGTISTTNMINLMNLSSNVDFVQMHLYFTGSLYTKTTEEIFNSTVMADKINQFIATINGFRKTPLLLDEYALHYNSTGTDERITNNIAAVWFATMHVLIASTPQIIGSTGYSLISNQFGLLTSSTPNVERPSGYIFKWSNQYLVGDVYLASSSYTPLKVLPVRSVNVSAVYIINTDANEVNFTLSGLNGAFYKNTVNATGHYENEVTPEWVWGVGGLHTISPYSVWVLWSDSANPPIIPTDPPTLAPTRPPALPYWALLSLSFTADNSTFDEDALTNTIAETIAFDPRYVEIISLTQKRSLRDEEEVQDVEDVTSYSITLKISANSDAIIANVIANLSVISDALTFAGYSVDSIQTVAVSTTSLPTTTTSASTFSSSTTSDIVYITGVPCSISNGTCADPGPSIRPFVPSLSGGLAAIVGLGFLVLVFAMVLLLLNWEAFKKKFGTFYCSVLLFGSLLGFVSVITLLPEQTDSLCLAFPWLLGVGFTLVYGCLFIKMAILYQVWRSSMKLQRTNITAITVIKYCGVALAVELVLLIVWSAVDPPTVHMTKLVDNTLQGHCHSKHPTFWIIFVCIKGAWLLFGAAISVLTREISKEYNDFTASAYAIYNNFILLVIAIPLAVLLEDVKDGVMIIEVVVVVLAFTFTIVFLFFDTWQRVLFPNHQTDFPVGSANMRASSASSTNSHSPHSSSSKNSGSGSGSDHAV